MRSAILARGPDGDLGYYAETGAGWTLVPVYSNEIRVFPSREAAQERRAELQAERPDCKFHVTRS